MTIRTAFVAAAAAIFLASCATGNSARRGGLSEEEVRRLPARVADSYDLFAQKCSRCHTLARPLSAGIDNHDHWERYVNRMRRQAGSGISAADGNEILVFLKYYTDQRTKKKEDSL